MSEMTLRMPSSFVDLDSEEMEYVDGGVTASMGGSGSWSFDVSREKFAFYTDLAIIIASFGISAAMTISSFLKQRGKVSGTQVIVTIATTAGVAKKIATKFGEVIMFAAGLTIGAGIAYLADYCDYSGLNGRVQF